MFNIKKGIVDYTKENKIVLSIDTVKLLIFNIQKKIIMTK